MMFQEDMAATLAALGKTMEISAGVMVLHLAGGFLYGFFAIWLYAAIRPRYGPGPKTAVCAGAALWFIGYLMVILALASLDLFPARLLYIPAAVGLVELVAATLLGAWLYKEA